MKMKILEDTKPQTGLLEGSYRFFEEMSLQSLGPKMPDVDFPPVSEESPLLFLGPLALSRGGEILSAGPPPLSFWF